MNRIPHETISEGVDPKSTNACWITSALNAYEGRLVRYANSMVGDINIAREIIQESFLKLCRQQQSEIEPHLPSWLFRVSRNLAIDHLRKEKRMKTSNLQTIDELVANRRPQSNAHDTVVNSETNRSIQTQVQQLPPSQQEVIRLRFENQMSYKQIADITGHTTGNVGFLLHTAIHKLRGALCES